MSIEVVKRYRTFLALLQELGSVDFEVVVCNQEVPYTITWDTDTKFTEVCMKRFGNLLKSPIKVTIDTYNKQPVHVVVLNDKLDYAECCRYFEILCGYCSEEVFEEITGIKD